MDPALSGGGWYFRPGHWPECAARTSTYMLYIPCPICLQGAAPSFSHLPTSSSVPILAGAAATDASQCLPILSMGLASTSLAFYACRRFAGSPRSPSAHSSTIMPLLATTEDTTETEEPEVDRVFTKVPLGILVPREPRSFGVGAGDV